MYPVTQADSKQQEATSDIQDNILLIAKLFIYFLLTLNDHEIYQVIRRLYPKEPTKPASCKDLWYIVEEKQDTF